MIKKLIIKNYRSIKNLNMELSDINALIGPNNSGKSNIMNALNLILGEGYPSIRSFDDRDFYCYDDSKPIIIETIFFAPLDKNPYIQSDIFGFRLEYNGSMCNYLAIDKNGDPCLWNNGKEVRVNTEMKDQVPLMYLGLDRQAHHQIKTNKWTIYGKMLKHIEKCIGEDDRESFKDDINEAYEKSIKPYLREFIEKTQEFIEEQTGLEMGFRLSPLDPIEILKGLYPYLKEKESNIEVNAESVGAGIQSALAIAIARAYSEIVKKPLVLAIEEPELYLHPHTCRYFYKLLKKLSKNGVQIIYTTHERSFVEILNYKDIHLIRKGNNGTYVKSGIELDLSPHETLKIATKFNNDLNEIFFANCVILVEGPTDKIAMQIAFEHLEYDIDKENISVVDCNSITAIKDITMILSHFDIPCYVVVDEDPGNEATKKSIAELETIIGKEHILLQSPNLESMWQLSKKPSKKEAFTAFSEQIEKGYLPLLYKTLKNKLEEKNDYS